MKTLTITNKRFAWRDWIDKELNIYDDYYYCPDCEKEDIQRGFNYCPNCGIKIKWNLG
jgi:hypothetical protein